MAYSQEPPFAVQVALTEGCNLQCSFCGINGIQEKPGKYKFMTPLTAETVARGIAELGWTARIEFAMNGEPTMNPQHAELVRIFRTHLPNNQLMLTSNGGGLLKPGKVQALFDAGLNILALDDYQNVNIVPRVRSLTTVRVVDYPQDNLDYSPHRRWPKNTKVVVVLQDIEQAAEGGHSTLNNHCGGGSPPNNSAAGKRCAKPFRELSVRWDGTVAGCCNDFRGIYKCGDLMAHPLAVVWNGPAFTAMRKKLMLGQRDFGACKGCDATSTRVGLLPDKLGKERLGPPTAEDLKALEQAVAGGSYTPIVWRPWE